MSYSPPFAAIPLPMVHPMGPWGFTGGETSASFPGSGTWPSANVAYYYAVSVPVTTIVRRLWWANGSTVSASYNLDCGIYADAGNKPGAKLVSTGSTAQGTASEVQFVDVTDTTLAPGVYWLALSCSSTSATVMRLLTVAWDAAVKFQEASAVPLPATATPVESASDTIHLFGFATTASP